MMVTVASSNTSHTPLVDPAQTSSEKPLSTSTSTSTSTSSTSSTQPFTDVLTEATSKVLRDGLDKPEALIKLSQKGEQTKAVPFKNAKEEHSGSSSKKSVAIDISTPTLPIIVPQVPPVLIESAPVAALAVAHLVKEPSSKESKVDAVTTIDIQESKPSTAILNVDAAKHPAFEHRDVREPELGALTPAVSPKAVVSEVPDPKVVVSVESAQVESAQAVESRDKSSTFTAGLTNPVSDKGEITMSSRSLLNDRASVPEVHPLSPVATESNPVAKPERLHDAPLRAKSVAPTSEHVSSIRISTQPEVVPVWPTQPSVVVSGVNTVAAPAHTTQPSPHSVDVGALAGAISRPLVDAREGYTVMIAMHPVELGHLQAAVTLHGSDLHVTITPQTQMGHDALTNAVDTLKTELSRGGVNVNVTLQDPGSQPGSGERPAATAVPREAFAHEELVAIASATPVLSANQINLVL